MIKPQFMVIYETALFVLAERAAFAAGRFVTIPDLGMFSDADLSCLNLECAPKRFAHPALETRC